MNKINPEQFYSLLQASELSGVKNRNSMAKYINEGNLQAVAVNTGVRKRYAIKGEWLISFMERLKKGLVKGEKYTITELRMTLQNAIEFCEKNNIKTLNELVKAVDALGE